MAASRRRRRQPSGFCCAILPIRKRSFCIPRELALRSIIRKRRLGLRCFRDKSAPNHPRFGAMVPAGSRHLWYRNFHSHHSGDGRRCQHRSSPQHRRAHSERHPRHEGRCVHRRAADRGNRVCRAAGRPRRPHPGSDPRLHRLCGRLAARGAVAPPQRNGLRRAALWRLHAVQLHDPISARTR
jgi:hypothetical protein